MDGDAALLYTCTASYSRDSFRCRLPMIVMMHVLT